MHMQKQLCCYVTISSIHCTTTTTTATIQFLFSSCSSKCVNKNVRCFVGVCEFVFIYFLVQFSTRIRIKSYTRALSLSPYHTFNRLHFAVHLFFPIHRFILSHKCPFFHSFSLSLARSQYLSLARNFHFLGIFDNVFCLCMLVFVFR